MISVNLIGGLGNQMFQIFCCIAYAKRNNLKFYLPTNLSSCSRSKTYWKTIFTNLKQYVKDVKLSKYNEINFNYNKIPLFNNKKLFGYFQSWKYFDDQYDYIYELLKIDEFKKSYDFKADCSMHFRLGDYKLPQFSHHHNILPYEYYDKAIKKLINKLNKDKLSILYFCEQEDNEMVLKNIKRLNKKYKNLFFIKAPDELDDWEQMILMSKCSHNIIANSSFSWWGAYLNSNKSKIVIHPSNWFKVDKKTDDLFYKNCVKINL